MDTGRAKGAQSSRLGDVAATVPPHGAGPPDGAAGDSRTESMGGLATAWAAAAACSLSASDTWSPAETAPLSPWLVVLSGSDMKMTALESSPQPPSLPPDPTAHLEGPAHKTVTWE